VEVEVAALLQQLCWWLVYIQACSWFEFLCASVVVLMAALVLTPSLSRLVMTALAVAQITTPLPLLVCHLPIPSMVELALTH
jgi:hypothetical protein